MERDDALRFLFDRVNYERKPPESARPDSFRLAPMRQLLARLGDPHLKVPVVHIAGTKGKGSTAAFTASTLTAAGYRTGLCTSPHLNRVEERFTVDGAECSAEQFVSLVQQVRAAAETMEGGAALTFFELTTALAFLHFAQSGADVAVVEVGLGGRLDSTNVCQPTVAAITTISFDHTRLLGNTLASIAAEKAGIIKAGVPVISGVIDDEPREVIRAVCAEHQAPLWEAGVDFSGEYLSPAGEQQHGAVRLTGAVLPEDFCRQPWELGLLGRHQAANAAIAAAILARLRASGWRIPAEALQRGLSQVRWPARFEVLRQRPLVVIDAAHNVASAAALRDTLATHTAAQRKWLIFGTSRDKDAAGMLRELAPWFDRIILTRFQNNPRGVPIEELANIAAEVGCEPSTIALCETPAAAWNQAQSQATEEDLICATGSIFLASEVRELIGTPAATPLAAAG